MGIEKGDLMTMLYPRGWSTEVPRSNLSLCCAGELKHTLVPDKLSSWIKRTNNKVLAAKYFELDKWMSVMVRVGQMDECYGR